MKPKLLLTIPGKLVTLVLLSGLPLASHAADVVAGDVTAVLGSPFFIDATSTGGGDTNASADVAFVRDFGIGAYSFNPAGTEVTIRGIGWAAPGSGVLATQLTVTIHYLGSDGIFGTEDDQLVGTVTDVVPVNTTAGERVWVFDQPMIANISGSSTRFRIRIQGNGNLRFKTNTGTTLAEAKLSVAGSYASSPLPDADGDGIPDVYETNDGVYVSVFQTGTDPAVVDSDGDGLPDGQELLQYGTNPNLVDTDRDGLSDGAEVLVHLTNPTNRDSDNDRLGDGYEIANNLNPLLNADADVDSYLDFLEVLFYGSNPLDQNSFPGDGTAAEPGGFTVMQSADFTSTPGGFDTVAAGLGQALVNEAAGGGGDFDFTTGNTNFIVHYPVIFPAPGSAVTLTGFAWPVVSASGVNRTGDILVQFYDPGDSPTPGGLDVDTLVGTAKGTLEVTGVNNIMFFKFDQPVTFTSGGTGLVVKFQSTSGLRIKAQDAPFSSGLMYTNDGRSTLGNMRSIRLTITGSALAPAFPEIVDISRNGNVTEVIWSRNGAATTTLQRSTDLENFFDVPGKTMTTETFHTETSSEARVFFRVVTP
jgi:hypothetical protein